MFFNNNFNLRMLSRILKEFSKKSTCADDSSLMYARCVLYFENLAGLNLE